MLIRKYPLVFLILFSLSKVSVSSPAVEGSGICILTNYCFGSSDVAKPYTFGAWNTVSRGGEFEHPDGIETESYRAKANSGAQPESQSANACFVAAVKRAAVLREPLQSEFNGEYPAAVACYPFVRWHFESNDGPKLHGMVSRDTKDVFADASHHGAALLPIEGDQRFKSNSSSGDLWFEPFKKAPFHPNFADDLKSIE